MTLEEFLGEWNSASPTVHVHTSGSTGKPKDMEVEKARMRASARMTCDFLALKPGDTALLCMPVDYIAGKMMAVRALEGNLRLISVEPSNHPLENLTEAPTFAAMIPSQVHESLANPLLRQIKKLIIGGGNIPRQLEEALSTFPNDIYSTYGMTETLSHIAMRRIGNPWYSTLPGISVSLTSDSCLVIDAPALCAEQIVTHDIAELNGAKRFRILGRSDNVICSGGIKIQIEEVEEALRPAYGDNIQITSRPDDKFGEAVVLLTTVPIDRQELKSLLPNPYWVPKHIVLVPSLPRTGSGKPDRAKAKKMT